MTHQADDNLPAALQNTLPKIPESTVRRRRRPPPKTANASSTGCSAPQRGLDNPALDTAIDIANELGLPVVVYFSAISNFPSANLRHYAFLNQGLRDIEADLAERGIAFIVRRPPAQLARSASRRSQRRDGHRRRESLPRARALAQSPRQAAARSPSGPSTPMSSSRPISSTSTSSRSNSSAPSSTRISPNTSSPRQNSKPTREWKRPQDFAVFDVHTDITHGWKDLDRSVKPVDSLDRRHPRRPQAPQALHRPRPRQLPGHAQPSRDSTAPASMSPYLHFGHISPLTIALAVAEGRRRRRRSPQTAYDSFIDELIGWRELSVNFVNYVPNYDTIDCAEHWAQKTLREHAARPARPALHPRATRKRPDLRRALERRAAADGQLRLDAQLHAHVLGQEDPRVVAQPRRRLPIRRLPQRQIRARRPRPQRLLPASPGPSPASSRPPLVRPPHLRHRSATCPALRPARSSIPGVTSATSRTSRLHRSSRPINPPSRSSQLSFPKWNHAARTRQLTNRFRWRSNRPRRIITPTLRLPEFRL